MQQELLAKRTQFNAALEKVLLLNKSRVENLLLSIDVGENFHIDGNLNRDGQEIFWKELNSCMQKFELHKINLKPKAKQKKKSKGSPVACRYYSPHDSRRQHHHQEQYRSKPKHRKSRHDDYEDWRCH